VNEPEIMERRLTEICRRVGCAFCLGVLLMLPQAGFAQEHARQAEPKTWKQHTEEGAAQSSEASGTPSAKRAEAVSSIDQAADRAPPPSTTHHSISLAGVETRYTATAATLPLRDAKGDAQAQIFYVAYTREPEDTKRPVTFVFNGGPGASSAYLHLGSMGPKVVDVSVNGQLLGPPPRLIDNDASWLAFTDLVFVDPVGTGYSRVVGSKDERDYFGVEQDAEALAEFIRLYLVEAGRVDSPVFLAGESYGGFRAAAIARKLQTARGISPSGLVLISPVLEFGLLHGEDYDPLTWALALPSYAAVNLESEGVRGRGVLAEALKGVEHYALTDYLVALASGGAEASKSASETVAQLTGLPVELVQQHLARIPASIFIKEFDRKNGQLLSRYDGSVGGPDPNPASDWPHGPDPVLDSTVPLWTTAFVQYAQNDLGYKTDAPYRLLNRDVRGKWDFGTSPTQQGYAGVLEDIQDARAANPTLQVFIATGFTDLITPYLASRYLIDQLPPLPGASPVEIENYPGGHMLYLRPDSRRELKQDVEAMYRRILGPSLSEG
jgi:carboxypeptidase C (cathepsin A)